MQPNPAANTQMRGFESDPFGSSAQDPSLSKEPVAHALPNSGTYAMPTSSSNIRYVGGPPQQMHINVGEQYDANSHNGLTAPPTGRWKDGLFDCCSNLWPSCGCLFIFGGVWLVAQISEKTNFSTFRNIVNAYFCMYILCFFLSLFLGGWVNFLPFLMVWIISINLRVHVANFYNIRGGCFQEFLTGMFCVCCSVPQIARHVYGYTKVYDGDSNPHVEDYYGMHAVGRSGHPIAGSYPNAGQYYGNNQQVYRNQGVMVV